MKLKKCVLCNARLTEENDSEEHIIPNAIGGRKKISGFICTQCNNISGNSWEAAIAKQLNPLSLLFGIRRQRGKVPSQVFKTTGKEKLELRRDGSLCIEKPTFSIDRVENNVNIKITARSIEEAKKILKGVHQKYPKSNLSEMVKNIDDASFINQEMIKFNLSFGGLKAGRSIVKSVLALICESGLDPKDGDIGIKYLKDENKPACFGHYYEKDLIINRPAELPLHCIAVKGDPSHKHLLGYVEYFGVQRVVMSLSLQYEGPPFEKNYSINPISGEELNIKVALELTPEDILSACNYEKMPASLFKKAFDNVLSPAITSSNTKDKVIEEAVKYAFENCGANKGDTLNPEQTQKLFQLVTERISSLFIENI